MIITIPDYAEKLFKKLPLYHRREANDLYEENKAYVGSFSHLSKKERIEYNGGELLTFASRQDELYLIVNKPLTRFEKVQCLLVFAVDNVQSFIMKKLGFKYGALNSDDVTTE